MRLLLIEDNARLGSLVRDGLIPQGFAVDWVETVEDAELAMKVATYDLLLVDLGYPMETAWTSSAVPAGTRMRRRSLS